MDFMFYAVEHLVEGKWRPFELLFDLQTAVGVARAVPDRHVVRVDLHAGWRDAGDGRWVHESMAAVRLPTTTPNTWLACRADRVRWDEVKRGQWFARWAALGFAVGPVVDARGRTV